MPTVATGTAGVAGNLQSEQQTYFSKMLLKQAKYKTILDQFAYTEKIPAASSKTISFTQYSDLPIATTPLTEGTPPAETLLTATPITATIDQYGAYAILTDLGVLTVKHPVVTKTNELLGVQAARTYDRVINSAVVAGTNVIYAGAATSRTTVTNATSATMTEIKKAVAILRANGAEAFDDGNFVAVIDISVEQDLMLDANFLQTVYRQQPNNARANELFKGTIVSFAGVTFVRSNNIPTIASTNTVHTTYVFGQDAYAATDLQTLQMYTQKPGGITDPIEQRTTMGWKLGMKAVILNQTFLVRIESGSTF